MSTRLQDMHPCKNGADHELFIDQIVYGGPITVHCLTCGEKAGSLDEWNAANPPPKPPPSEKDIIAPLACLDKKYVERVLTLYAAGVPLEYIAWETETSTKQVDAILDDIAPYMGCL